MNAKFYIKLLLLITIFFSLFSCKTPSKEEDPWTHLFNGQNLDNWDVKGGDAKFFIRDKAIVGATAYDTASVSTFLISKKEYGDFILEVETKVDTSMNSGILFRSKSKPSFQNGRVYGYQAEIDPSDRAWSGGIYESAKRGWLYTLEENPKAREAFKRDGWNHYRIEAIGDTIKTWINGVPAAYLIDGASSKGFIALQVHGIHKDDEEGTEVLWRNIKILTENLDKFSRETPLTAFNTANRLTTGEIEDGWEMLWDGKTSQGWRGAKLDSFPETGWKIKNGILMIDSSGGGESKGGGDIVTKKLYGDFELKVDFKIEDEKAANSGIKYYVDTDIKKVGGSSVGLEYQILGKKHPGNKEGNHEGSHKMASLYDLIPADPIPANPAGEWNTAKILSKGGHVEHWLNGTKVLEYNRFSDQFEKLVQESKYSKYPGFGELAKGRILLQDHGSLVEFKNIKIKEL